MRELEMMRGLSSTKTAPPALNGKVDEFPVKTDPLMVALLPPLWIWTPPPSRVSVLPVKVEFVILRVPPLASTLK